LLLFGWLVWLFSQHQIVITFEKGADVATLTLTAATLVVTGVGVAIAVVTIWGYREIRDRAVRMAVREALKAVSSSIRGAYQSGYDSPDPAQADEIARAVDEVVTTEADGEKN
jgi:hypothetical protein